MPLARAETDAGVTADDEDAIIRVSSVLEDMRAIVRKYPPLTKAWTSVMTHGQNLIFAEAELTRLTGPDPDVWLRARDNADYAYYRTYATWRTSEALIDLGRRQEASRHLNQAVEEATSMQARSLGRRITKTAQAAGIQLGG